MIAYKAVRLDRTSHYDETTKWRVGRIIRPDSVDDNNKPCGHGIHCSPTLLGAVGYQRGLSLYCEVEPRGVLGQDHDKLRCREVKVLRWLGAEEQDLLAGFKLWEANNPVNPLLIPGSEIPEPELMKLVRAWDSVGASVGASVWDSVRASVGASVRDSVRDSVGASVGDSVWDSVGASVGDSVRAYTGGLFPQILTWKYAESLGPDPWRPLLKLWYSGYLPSFDGTTWRLHRGTKAEVVLEWKPCRS